MKVLTTIRNIIDERTIKDLRTDGIEIIEVEVEIFKSGKSVKELNDVNIIVGGAELKSLSVGEFPQLQLIQTITAGYDYLEIETIMNRGIYISNASGIYSVPIAEWVLGQVLFAYKKFQSFKEAQDDHQWKPDYKLRELSGKKILVFGTGSIGVEVCKRFDAFDCEVDGVNSDGRLINGFKNCYSLDNSQAIIREYDILVFALPSNIKTRNFLNESVLNEIPDDCVLINVGRGDLIKEDDLLRVLKEKNEVLVFLDVLKTEPLPKESDLWNHPQIFVTPHNSFSSINNKSRLQELIISNILNLKKNRKIRNRIQ